MYFGIGVSLTIRGVCVAKLYLLKEVSQGSFLMKLLKEAFI